MTPDSSCECFEFADFRLLPQQRTLLLRDRVVPTGGRAFDLLLALVSRAGVVVSIGELMRFVWPSVTVEEANLRVQMGVLRKTLSQCPEAMRSIETIPMRGYCFILPVRHVLKAEPATAMAAAGGAALPPLLSPVVGRDDIIALVRNTLDTQRLISITGPGGIGKTTVAVAIASNFSATAGGTTVFVDLALARNCDEATAAIAQALDLVPAPGSPEALSERLIELDALLVLDTCEHLVDAIAQLAETLVARCRMLRLLVTSREALRARNEWTYRLGSLAVPDLGVKLTEANMADYAAVTLFVDRARSMSGFTPDAYDLEFVAEICRRLDGIPLALELAAARMSDLGLQAITARLDDCFSILTRGRRTALPRHRTLAATHEWSYNLLSGAEQKALAWLARIEGPFTSEAAIALCADAGLQRPPEALSSLYEKSLLSVECRDGLPLYRLLATTKAYAMASGSSGSSGSSA